MALSFTIAFVSQLMTFEATIFRVEFVTTTLAMKIWSSWVMKRSARNETLDVRAYNHSLHTVCPLLQMRACMTSRMTSCVAIH
jgi:hypothetical protein